MSVKHKLQACKIAHVKGTLKTQKIIHITKKLIAAHDDLYLVNIECTWETIEKRPRHMLIMLVKVCNMKYGNGICPQILFEKRNNKAK